jgi:hypothetical protein
LQLHILTTVTNHGLPQPKVYSVYSIGKYLQFPGGFPLMLFGGDSRAGKSEKKGIKGKDTDKLDSKRVK